MILLGTRLRWGRWDRFMIRLCIAALRASVLMPSVGGDAEERCVVRLCPSLEHSSDIIIRLRIRVEVRRAGWLF